jgi:hypothetical protein
LKGSASNIIVQIISLIIIVDLIHTATFDLILYNSKTLGTPLEFLFYISPSLVSIFLAICISLWGNRFPSFILNFLFVLINIYLLTSFLGVFLTSCDETKNLNVFYTILVVLLDLITIGLLFFKIIPRIGKLNILIIAVSTLVLMFDFFVFLIGYDLLYPIF